MGEQGAQGVSIPGPLETRERRGELADLERSEELHDLVERPKPAESDEPTEGDEELRLVVGVPVVALEGVEGQARPILALEALAGLRGIRVALDGERLGGRDHLQQEGQLARVGARRGGAEQGLGRAPDALVERAPEAAVRHAGGRPGMGPDPELGLGPAALVRAAEEAGDGVSRAPGVVLDGVVQGEHARSHAEATISAFRRARRTAPCADAARMV
jgi:hypothetical protein